MQSKVLPFPYPKLYLSDLAKYESGQYKACPRYIAWIRRVRSLDFGWRNPKSAVAKSPIRPRIPPVKYRVRKMSSSEEIRRSPTTARKLLIAIRRGGRNFKIRCKTSADLWRRWITGAQEELEEAVATEVVPPVIIRIEKEVVTSREEQIKDHLEIINQNKSVDEKKDEDKKPDVEKEATKIVQTVEEPKNEEIKGEPEKVDAKVDATVENKSQESQESPKAQETTVQISPQTTTQATSHTALQSLASTSQEEPPSQEPSSLPVVVSPN